VTDKTQQYINSDGYLYKYGTATRKSPFNKDDSSSDTEFSFTASDVDSSKYTYIVINHPEVIN
jgi:hypothetical protein